MVSRDVLLNNNEIIIPYSYDGKVKTFFNIDSLKDNFVIPYYINEKESLNLNFVKNYIGNDRDHNLSYKIGYNENIFKPYYRKLIP